jgi:hypothetical protein
MRAIMLADPAGCWPGSECPWFPKVLQQARNRIPVATSTLELHLGRLASTFAIFANKPSWLGLLGLKVAANSVTLHS